MITYIVLTVKQHYCMLKPVKKKSNTVGSLKSCQFGYSFQLTNRCCFARFVYKMAASGRVKTWKDIFQSNTILPVAFDREKAQTNTFSPFCISLKSVEGLISKVLNLVIFFEIFDDFTLTQCCVAQISSHESFSLPL